MENTAACILVAGAGLPPRGPGLSQMQGERRRQSRRIDTAPPEGHLILIEKVGIREDESIVCPLESLHQTSSETPRASVTCFCEVSPKTPQP